MDCFVKGQPIHGQCVLVAPSPSPPAAGLAGRHRDELLHALRAPVHADHWSPLMLLCLQGITFVNQYIIVGTLGRGAFGKVKLVLNSEDHNLYAIKLVSRGSAKRNRMMQRGRKGSEQDDVNKELDVMKTLHHPHVVCLYEIIGEPHSLWLWKEEGAGSRLEGDVSQLLPCMPTRGHWQGCGSGQGSLPGCLLPHAWCA